MRHVTCAVFTLALAVGRIAAQERDYVHDHYSKHEYHIPMRDGARLFLIAYVPNDTAQRYPIILTRTPYSVRPYEPDSFPHSPDNQRRAYFHAGYIVAFEDVRGRYMSEGQYVNVRPYVPVKHGPQDIDETTDTYDTVEWLIQHVHPNNGRVGISGISYPGFYSSMGAIDAHPAVKAVSPQAPVSKWMGGDDFFHIGALLFPHAFDFYLSFGKARPGPHPEPDPQFEHGTPDGYEFYLNLGPVANGNARYMHDSVPFWNELTAHGTWSWSPGDSLGAIAWGQATSLFYTDSIELPFMNYYLKDGSPKPREFEAAVFETGTNAWHFLERWPPAAATPRRLYLREHEVPRVRAGLEHRRFE